MSRTRKIVDTTVRADIRPAGDFGMASFGGMTHSEAEMESRAEELAARIRQHCADLLPSRGLNRSQGVHVVHEYEHVCSHCGAPWGGASEYDNPECCPAAWADHAKGALEEVGDGLRLVPDGDRFALVGPDFVDLQESDVIAWLPAPEVASDDA